ncbi:MAG: DNA-binding protein AraC-type [Herbinix sp.]|jgi:AraC-like DNA-binding protein|nr:DNA-binding protein AraC-type [Herbinix sp.]
MSVQTIETMAKWVENNIKDNPTLIEMSSYVGYSPFYCSSKFREHMGLTYKQFLSRCRLKAATSDLCNTDDKIIDIALRYGYSSAESLTRAFVTVFQCSPREYRKMIKEVPLQNSHGIALPPNQYLEGEVYVPEI